MIFGAPGAPFHEFSPEQHVLPHDLPGAFNECFVARARINSLHENSNAD